MHKNTLFLLLEDTIEWQPIGNDDYIRNETLQTHSPFLFKYCETNLHYIYHRFYAFM